MPPRVTAEILYTQLFICADYFEQLIFPAPDARRAGKYLSYAELEIEGRAIRWSDIESSGEERGTALVSRARRARARAFWATASAFGARLPGGDPSSDLASRCPVNTPAGRKSVSPGERVEAGRPPHGSRIPRRVRILEREYSRSLLNLSFVFSGIQQRSDLLDRKINFQVQVDLAKLCRGKLRTSLNPRFCVRQGNLVLANPISLGFEVE
jgi:hypothetical protein